jgi:hypothetical protein
VWIATRIGKNESSIFGSSRIRVRRLPRVSEAYSVIFLLTANVPSGTGL